VQVPLFVGVTSVQIRRRFDVSAVYDEARSRLAGYFARRLKR
jgi:hypothetical protein